MDDPINNRDNFVAGIFYYNPEDDRIMIKVPGTVSRYVFNYARRQSYIFIVAGITLLVLAYLRSR